jgi:phosphoglycolate phosphatase-like HAD superfamily hydrolase
MRSDDLDSAKTLGELGYWKPIVHLRSSWPPRLDFDILQALCNLTEKHYGVLMATIEDFCSPAVLRALESDARLRQLEQSLEAEVKQQAIEEQKEALEAAARAEAETRAALPRRNRFWQVVQDFATAAFDSVQEEPARNAEQDDRLAASSAWSAIGKNTIGQLKERFQVDQLLDELKQGLIDTFRAMHAALGESALEELDTSPPSVAIHPSIAAIEAMEGLTESARNADLDPIGFDLLAAADALEASGDDMLFGNLRDVAAWQQTTMMPERMNFEELQGQLETQSARLDAFVARKRLVTEVVPALLTASQKVSPKSLGVFLDLSKEDRNGIRALARDAHPDRDAMDREFVDKLTAIVESPTFFAAAAEEPRILQWGADIQATLAFGNVLAQGDIGSPT